MASFVDLVAAAKLVQSEMTAGRYAHAMKASAAIIDGAADLAISVGFQSTPAEMTAKQELKDCLTDLDKECDNHIQKVAAASKGPKGAAQPAGKLWDGKILEFLKTILPLILPLLI